MADSKPDTLAAAALAAAMLAKREVELDRIRARLIDVKIILDQYAKNQMGAAGADERIMEILFKLGFAREMRIHPMEVGFHKLNRGAILGNSMAVHVILANIFHMSFSWKECSHAICVRVGMEDRSHEDAFREWCSESPVDFPPVRPMSLFFAALACGHTNVGLRAIFSRCLCDNVDLGDGTRFDPEVIRKKDAPYAEAAEKGLHWTVIEQIIVDAFPALVGLIDASRNALGHVQTDESEVSGGNKIVVEWDKARARQEEPDFAAISAAVVRSRPFWMDRVVQMAAFLSTQSGGHKAAEWAKFKRIHNHFVPSCRRQIPGHIFESLAKVKWVKIAYAILLTVCLCPESGVVNKQCEWVKLCDLDKVRPNPMKQPAVVKALQDAANFLEALERCLGPGGSLPILVAAACDEEEAFNEIQRETTAAAKKVQADKCSLMYVQSLCSTGRFLCGKPQDEEYSTAAAESLSDLHAMIVAARNDNFPDVRGDVGLELMVPWKAVPVEPAAKLSEQKPVAKPTASSVAIPMPMLCEMDESTGRQDGVFLKLADQGLELRSKVVHNFIRGVYSITEVGGLPGAEKVRLKKIAEAISMEDLWGELDAKKAQAEAVEPVQAEADAVVPVQDQAHADAVEPVQAQADEHADQFLSLSARSKCRARPSMLSTSVLGLTGKTGAVPVSERDRNRACSTTAEFGSESSPTAEPAAHDPGSDESDEVATDEVATEPDYSFKDELSIKVAKFLKEWRAVDKKITKFSFNPVLTDAAHQLKDKMLRTSLLALAHTAVQQLATTLEGGIQAEKLTLCVKEPVVEVFAYPGHHEQGINR